MTSLAPHPSERREKMQKPVDVPGQLLDRLVPDAFDYVWFPRVWQTGAVARKTPLQNTEWRRQYRDLSPAG